MCRWFYGDITSDHAKQILMQAGKHGSFLVRNRQSVEHQFAMSVLLDSDVLHVVIVYEVSMLTIRTYVTLMCLSVEIVLQCYFCYTSVTLMCWPVERVSQCYFCYTSVTLMCRPVEIVSQCLFVADISLLFVCFFVCLFL